MTKYDDLRRLAEAASKWGCSAEEEIDYWDAVTPAAILALLKELDAAREALKNIITGNGKPSLREWLNQGGTEEEWYEKIASAALERMNTTPPAAPAPPQT